MPLPRSSATRASAYVTGVILLISLSLLLLLSLLCLCSLLQQNMLLFIIMGNYHKVRASAAHPEMSGTSVSSSRSATAKTFGRHHLSLSKATCLIIRPRSFYALFIASRITPCFAKLIDTFEETFARQVVSDKWFALGPGGPSPGTRRGTRRDSRP